MVPRRGAKYGWPMDPTAARRHSLAVRLVTSVWPARGWRHTRFVAAGIAVQLSALALLAAPWVAFAFPVGFVPETFTQVMLAIVVPVAVLLIALPTLSAAQRHRLRAMLGLDISRPPVTGRRLTWGGLAAWARSEATWRQLGYHVVVAPMLAAGGLLTVGLWAAGVALPVAGALAKAFPWSSSMAAGGGKPLHPALIVIGFVLLLAAPRVAGGVARLDIRAATALLGPSRAKELEQRVETLAESRSGVVDAADAERRRIERDLHDGAQQRLVSLAMNLGLARESLLDLPDAARQVITEAHEEAKEALTELRTLVRGLHPAILDDRGLDAALSGIAARAPVPVRLRVDVPGRASPTVEAVAYFVVSEALANIAKHARASRAEIDVWRHGDVLRVSVTDHGTGGADPSRGTGLAGLAQRVRSVDGTMSVSSPAGGPTVVVAELPCAS